MRMKISVALIPLSRGELLGDCVYSVVNQRVVKADEIRIYDAYADRAAVEAVSGYPVRIIGRKPGGRGRGGLLDSAEIMELIRAAVRDTDENDILILIADDEILDPSAISELFRYFLKYQDMALVYGRQIAAQECNPLTRYVHKALFPISRRDVPIWHLMKIFNSYRLIAYRVKFLREPDVMPEPGGVSSEMFGHFYIAAKLSEKGFRIMYNPLAMSHCSRNLTVRSIYVYARGMFKFLKCNEWLTDKWWLRKTDLETFFIHFKWYIRNGSSIPFHSLYATVCYAAARIGELLAEMDYQRFQKNQPVTGRKLLANTLFDKKSKLYR